MMLLDEAITMLRPRPASLAFADVVQRLTPRLAAEAEEEDLLGLPLQRLRPIVAQAAVRVLPLVALLAGLARSARVPVAWTREEASSPQGPLPYRHYA